METAIVKVKDLKPAAYNPRKTLAPGDTEYDALKNSMERFGVAEPLIVNRRTGNLVSGHQRLNVLRETGAEEVEAVIIDMDESDEKLLNIALNKIEGDWDYLKLRELFEEIDTEDIEFTGFTEEEVSALFDAELPDFDEEEEKPAKESKEKPEEPEKEFMVFLSFPTKEAAEDWLAEHDMDEKFEGAGRNITIQMEGDEYGTRG